MGRKILAVVVGYIVIVALFGLTYLLALAFFPGAVPKPGSGVAPSSGFLAVAATLSFLYAFLGGWVTTVMANRSGVGPGLILAGTTLFFGLLKPLLAPHQEPLWSHMILLVAGVAGATIGAYATASSAARSGNPVIRSDRGI
jgi:hypothetical protein